MRRFVRGLLTRLAEERGDVFVEYVVLAAVAVMVILAAVTYFGQGIADMFRSLIDAVKGI